jgi:hypothetical protein
MDEIATQKQYFETRQQLLDALRKISFSIFPSPDGKSLTKLSLGGNNEKEMKLFPPRESLVSDILAGDGNIEKLFLRYSDSYSTKLKAFFKHDARTITY